MSTTVNETIPGSAATTDVGADAGKSNDSPPASRPEAVGAEVPVIVHASRYSATTRGVGKNLPPVHEETRTVIVFPTGAVVRLSANITTGEIVVLTNQQSGADVICRVANVKAQSGSQHYVNLEFTQRAPGFWGNSLPADHATRSEGSDPSAIQLISPLTGRVPAAEAPPVPKQAISVPAAELISAVEAVTQLLSTGALPAISSSAKRGESDILDEPGSGAPMLEAAVVEAPMLDGPMLDGRALDRPMAADSTSAALPEAADPGTAETVHARQMLPETGGEAVTPLLRATQEHIEAQADTVSLPRIAAAPSTGRTRVNNVTGITTAAKIASALNHHKESQPLSIEVRAGTHAALPAAASALQADDLTSIAVNSAKSKATPNIVLSMPSPVKNASPEILKSTAQSSLESEQFDIAAQGNTADSKKIMMIAVAAVVLLVLGGAAGALLFHGNRPAALQQSITAPPPVPQMIPAQPPAMTSLQPAVTATSASTQPAASSASEPVKRADNDALRLAPNAGIRRAGGPVVSKLAAPVAKANTQAALIEPPPVIAGSPNTLENSGLFDAGRGNGPAMPAVPVSRMGGQLQQPKLISSPSASYPSAARAGRVQGVVVIDAEIDTTGKVASMKPIIGHILLQPAAMAALSTWKYEPARLNGEAIPMHIRVNIEFHLQ